MGKKNKKHKFNHLSPPSNYTYDDFKSINGGVSRRYIYNKGKRSDVFGRTSEKEKWSNPYTAWEKYNTSGLMPYGFQPSSYQTIRNYNSISYNYLKDADNLDINKGKTNRKKIIPNNTIDSSQLLYNNIKVAKSEYNNYLRNKVISIQMKKNNDKKLNNIIEVVSSGNVITDQIISHQTILRSSYSPSFFYSSPVKYTRDYFGSTLYKNTKNSNPSIADLEKLVSSQYWIPKSKLPHAQGSGRQVYHKSLPNSIPITEWYKYYPKLPLNYYYNSFL